MMTAKRNRYGNVVNLEKFAEDGRLTEPSNGKKYHWKKMIDIVEKTGRPLNKEEIDSYRVR